MPEGSKRHRRREHQPGWKGFRTDLRSSWGHLFRRSSTDHKRFVFLVLAIGVILRILRLDGPVTYDEALTYVNYSSRSFGFLFSDYMYTGNHILHSAFVRISTLIFGVHLWSLRLPALIAGILAMPLFYAFVRALFNRHIAVIALCLLAVSGPLVEYSALARGYGLTWFFMVCSLLAARHFVKHENSVSVVMLGLFCALGMWAAPVMIYPALMVFIWAFFMLVTNYQSTVRRRIAKLAGSFLLFILLSLLFYSPVIIKHSLDQLIHHPSLDDNTWAAFVNTQQDRAFDLWAYFTGTASTVLAFLGAVGIIYSAYASVKYRLLLFAMIIGSVPLVIIQHMVAPPAVWSFCLFVLHLGTAIGAFYLMKLVQDKLAPRFNKPQRTLVAGLFMLTVFGWFGVRGQGDPVERFPEAGEAAEWIKKDTKPGDRVYVALPWDAPVEFHLACDRGDPQVFKGKPVGVGTTYVLVAPGAGQTPLGVMNDDDQGNTAHPELRIVKNWKRLELYSDRP